jgi:hypothetical protein
VGTPVPEGQTRSIDQIPNGACRQDLPGAGKCHDAGGKMQGDREAVAPHLAFAGMNASANREAQRAGAYDELLLSIAPHGLARRTTPEHRRRSDVPRAVAMKPTRSTRGITLPEERTYAQALRVSPTTSRPYTTQYKSQAKRPRRRSGFRK